MTTKIYKAVTIYIKMNLKEEKMRNYRTEEKPAIAKTSELSLGGNLIQKISIGGDYIHILKAPENVPIRSLEADILNFKKNVDSDLFYGSLFYSKKCENVAYIVPLHGGKSANRVWGGVAIATTLASIGFIYCTLPEEINVITRVSGSLCIGGPLGAFFGLLFGSVAAAIVDSARGEKYAEIISKYVPREDVEKINEKIDFYTTLMGF